MEVDVHSAMLVVGTRSQLVARCEDGLEKSRRRVKSSTNHHRSTKVQVDEKGLDRALAEWVKAPKDALDSDRSRAEPLKRNTTTDLQLLS
jgi:hypothetical protein